MRGLDGGDWWMSGRIGGGSGGSVGCKLCPCCMVIAVLLLLNCVTRNVALEVFTWN